MGKDVSLDVYPNNYVVVDIETTGLSPEKSEIIEISAIKVLGGIEKETFSKLIKPKRKVNSFITSLTGITNKMLENANDLSETLEEFKEFSNGYVIMGHNVKFDIRFLNFYMQKVLNVPFDNDYIDTLRIARKMLPELKSHRLGILAEHYNIDKKGMHRALKDCEVTKYCYNQMTDICTV